MTTCIRRPLSRYTTCRCERCAPAVRKVYKMQRDGRLTRASSDLAWERIDQWTADGYTPAWISSALGIPHRGIASAIDERKNGRRRKFGPERARIIIAGDMSKGARGYCSAIGARRRLQALAVIGYSVEEMQTISGIHFVTMACIQRGVTERVSARLHHAIAAMYDTLKDVDGPCRNAATTARNKGWEPPFAWEDPDHDPDVEQHVIGAKLEDWRWLVDAGESEEVAARRVGVQLDSIRQAIVREKKAPSDSTGRSAA